MLSERSFVTRRCSVGLTIPLAQHGHGIIVSSSGPIELTPGGDGINIRFDDGGLFGSGMMLPQLLQMWVDPSTAIEPHRVTFAARAANHGSGRAARFGKAALDDENAVAHAESLDDLGVGDREGAQHSAEPLVRAALAAPPPAVRHASPAVGARALLVDQPGRSLHVGETTITRSPGATSEPKGTIRSIPMPFHEALLMA